MRRTAYGRYVPAHHTPGESVAQSKSLVVGTVLFLFCCRAGTCLTNPPYYDTLHNVREVIDSCPFNVIRHIGWNGLSRSAAGFPSGSDLSRASPY